MRLAIIGLKGHQNVVMDGAKKLGNVELVAYSDDVPALHDKFKKRDPAYGKAQGYSDWRMLLEHAAFDVACLCDENGIRAEQLLALADRGVHIVTEKPLATTLADLERVAGALAKSKGRTTMLLTMRHEAPYIEVKRLVAAGAIGTVCQIETQKSYRLETRLDWFRDRNRLGGTIPYIGIHAVDLMRWTTGLEYQKVVAFQGSAGYREVMGDAESHASLLFQMTNGASAVARLDYLRPHAADSHGDDRLRIAGTEGILQVTYPNKTIQLLTNKKGAETLTPKPTNNLFVEFMTAISENRPSRIPLEDCVEATRLVLKAREAAERGEVLALK